MGESQENGKVDRSDGLLRRVALVALVQIEWSWCRCDRSATILLTCCLASCRILFCFLDSHMPINDNHISAVTF